MTIKLQKLENIIKAELKRQNEFILSRAERIRKEAANSLKKWGL